MTAVHTAMEGLRAKRILVTGGSGFIGNALCARLADIGAEAHAISRSGVTPHSRATRTWSADLADRGALHRVFAEVRPHVVFHLAGYVYGSRALEHVQPAVSGNFTTTVNVLEIAAGSSCERVVLTGSQDEPDPGEADAAQFVPSSPYAAAKFAGNAYARMFGALYRLPVSIARIFMAYGPGQRDRAKLIPHVILALSRGEVPQLSTAARPLDWIYIDDVVEGLCLTAGTAGLEGRTIDLGTGVAHTARQAVERIVAIMGSSIAPVYGAIADRPLERQRVANLEATRSMLGWIPATSLEAGLRRTIDWYLERKAK